MPCFSPIQGFQRFRRSPTTGSHGITFKHSESNGNKLTVPCGQCIGCRIDKSREWAIRCVHEASLHPENQFLTLTYAPEHLPPDGSLQSSHFVKFMKRYRKAIAPRKIRFFHCGEYGEKLSRPHYHAIIFNHRFADLSIVGTSPSGLPLYTSARLERLWGHGYVTIGDVTWQSAAYVARYVTKKITGPLAAEHYKTVSLATGELHDVSPEYVTMSNRPGIGHDWFLQYQSDCYPSDFVVHKGKKQPIPRYYDKLFQRADPDSFNTLRLQRKQKALLHAENNTPERLAIREYIQALRLNKLTRSLHHES